MPDISHIFTTPFAIDRLQSAEGIRVLRDLFFADEQTVDIGRPETSQYGWLQHAVRRFHGAWTHFSIAINLLPVLSKECAGPK